MTWGIITINNGRPKVFKLFCASMKRLRTQVGINFPVVCVSGIEDRKTCDEYGIGHIVQANQPVSRKWDTACKYMQKLGCTYILILGSDDILSTTLLKSLISEMNKGISLIGIKELYFYGTEKNFKGKLLYIRLTTLAGVCRTIHKSILDKVDWMPWNADKNWGLDGLAMKRIRPYVTTQSIVEGKVFDIKTRESLNHFSYWNSKIRQETPATVFYETLSEEELEILKTI